MTKRPVIPNAVRNLHLAITIAAITTSCGECIGTPSCRVDPEISAQGQIVDHASGAGVGGTSVIFVRDSGVVLDADSVKAVADDDGYFTLRMGAQGGGIVFGHVEVAGPAPFEPYTIPLLQLETTQSGGDGTFIGRLVVRPYFRFLATVRDRATQGSLDGVSVKWRRNSGGRVAEDSITFVSDAGGVIAWHPEVLVPGTINATFEIDAPGHSRTYVFTRNLPMSFREGETKFESIPVGFGISYFAGVTRRALGRALPGTTVELTRLSGVAIQPQVVTVEPNASSTFDIALVPQTPGSLYVQMRILPPPPFVSETRTLALATSDDDTKQWLGFMGYGAQAGFTARLIDDETGAPIPEQTPVRIRRVTGLDLQWPDAPPPEGDYRVTQTNGRIEYGAPTADTGSVAFDLTVQLPAPFAWDTLRGIVVPSRFNDTLPDRGVMVVRRRPRP